MKRPTKKSKVGTSKINRARWTRQRISDIIAHLNGSDTKSGEYTQLYYPQYKFTTKNGRLYAESPSDGKREILSPERATRMIQKSYSSSEGHVGRIPSTYHTLRKKYIGVSFPLVEKAIKSTKNYQLNDARQISKPSGGQAIVIERVGALIEVDLMVFSGNATKGILPQNKNKGFVGLVVVVDALSQYVVAEPYKSKEPDWIAGITRRLLAKMRTAGIKLKGGTCTSDRGAEFNTGRPGIFSQTVTAFGLTYKPLPAGRPAVHVESANKNIRMNINSRLAASKSKNWVNLVSKMIGGLNNTSFTDWRAPMTPREVVKLSPAKQVALAKKTYVKKKERNIKKPGAKLKALEIGAWVRIALEGKVKGAKIGAKGPKQRWSSKTYQVVKVSKTEMYTLSSMPKRRFARYWLQLISGKEDYAGPDIKKLGSSSYKPRAPKVDPKPTSINAIKKSVLGSKGYPYHTKAQVLKQGYKPGDNVWYRNQFGTPKQF